jgi:hypothetical protein
VVQCFGSALPHQCTGIGAYTDQSRFISVTYRDRDLVLTPPMLRGIPLMFGHLVHGRGTVSLVTVSITLIQGVWAGSSSLHMKTGRVHGIGFGTGEVPRIASNQLNPQKT